MKIEIPTNCPCCNSTLELVNDQLFCRNSACGAQLSKKLEHFCKVLGIKGFGPKTLEKLNLGDLTELYYLDEEEVSQLLGSDRLAEKLIEEINHSRGATLSTVLAAFSIPLVGETASRKIAEVVDHVEEITFEKCKEAGLGDKVSENLLTWLDTEYQDLKEFLPFSFRSEKKTVVNAGAQTVCITGKLKSFKTKAEATTKLTEAGFRVVDSVTKNLDYLVDEQDNNSAKRKKAQEYGTKIINNLINFLEEVE